MGVEIDRNGLEVLDTTECLRLLAGSSMGRIGISSGALPVILPVNYHLHGERILIRTGAGTKLDAATRNTVVAFEVDDFDTLYHSGWSVMVTGESHEVTGDELEALADVPLTRWAPHGDGHVVAISTELISGRRIPAHHTQE